TIHYRKIDTTDGAWELVSRIEKFIDHMGTEADSSHETEITLDVVARNVEKILHRLESGVGMRTGLAQARQDIPLDLSLNPREAFMRAFASGDLDRAVSLLPRVEALIGRNKEWLTAAMMCTQAGSHPA